MTIPTTFSTGVLAGATPRLRPRSSRRWTTLSILMTATVLIAATVVGVDVGTTGAAATPVPQSIAAPAAGPGVVGPDRGARDSRNGMGPSRGGRR